MFIKKTVTLLSFIILISSIISQNNIKLYDAKTLEPLAFAHVSITNKLDNKKFQTSSDEFGNVELSNEVTGKVDIEVSHVSYQTLYKTIEIAKINSLYLFPYDEKIEQVVVTANMKDVTTKESIYKIEVIDKEEIESMAANTLEDVLMYHEKFEISHDVLGTSISMQGLGGQNIKIMIDGVPIIGRMNGQIDISKINLNNIDRIEIVEGPLSVIYGSNALAGVINLITKKTSKKKINTALNTFYQTTGNYNIDAQVSYKAKNHFFNLSGGRYFFGGWHDGKYDRDLSWDPKESYFSDFSYVYKTKTDWSNRIKFSYFQDKLLDRKNPSGPFSKADDVWFKTRRIDLAYILSGSYKENFYIHSTNGYNNYQRIKNTYTKDLSTLETSLKENSLFSNFQDTTLLHQYISRTSIAYNNKESKYNYQIGYDLSIETGKGKRFYKDNNKEIILADIVAFATFTYKPIKKLSIQPAIRYGYNSKFTTIPTVSASIKYDFTENLIWRISYGMGFRSPTLKEMYLNFVDINHNIQGNKDLKPEKSHNVSTNLDYTKNIKLHKLNFKLNGFFNHKYDGIILAQKLNSTDETEYTYVNSYKYQTLGFDFDLSYRYKNFNVSNGFSYVGRYNQEKENNKELQQFFFKPIYSLNASYNIKKIGLKFSFFNKLVGGYSDYYLDDNDNFVAVKLNAYDIMDFNISETIWKQRITLTAGIKNILDVKTVNQSIGSGGAHSSRYGTSISTGRSYFVGFKIKY